MNGNDYFIEDTIYIIKPQTNSLELFLKNNIVHYTNQHIIYLCTSAFMNSTTVLYNRITLTMNYIHDRFNNTTGRRYAG